MNQYTDAHKRAVELENKFMEMRAEINRLQKLVTEQGREVAITRERNEAQKKEIERLRAAGLAVVKDYPIAAGTVRLTGDEQRGYGSILALRLALEQSARKSPDILGGCRAKS